MDTYVSSTVWVSHGDDVEMLHNGEAFWIQTRVLKWAGYPKITTIEQYFDLIESYVQANPKCRMEQKICHLRCFVMTGGIFVLKMYPQFLDGFPNDGSCMVDTETKKVMDYNVTDTAKRYFGKLNEEFHKGIMDPGRLMPPMINIWISCQQELCLGWSTSGGSFIMQ